MGFKLNLYNLCVANRIIKGKQYTTVWYVDNNKVSHIEAKVVDLIIKKIERKFRKMSQTWGKNYKFVGIDIKYNDKKVSVSMKKHIQKAIESFNKDITRNVAT